MPMVEKKTERRRSRKFDVSSESVPVDARYFRGGRQQLSGCILCLSRSVYVTYGTVFRIVCDLLTLF